MEHEQRFLLKCWKGKVMISSIVFFYFPCVCYQKQAPTCIVNWANSDLYLLDVLQKWGAFHGIFMTFCMNKIICKHPHKSVVLFTVDICLLSRVLSNVLDGVYWFLLWLFYFKYTHIKIILRTLASTNNLYFIKNQIFEKPKKNLKDKLDSNFFQ